MASRGWKPFVYPPPRAGSAEPASLSHRTHAAPTARAELQDLLWLSHRLPTADSRFGSWGTEPDSLRENPCARTPIHTHRPEINIPPPPPLRISGMEKKTGGRAKHLHTVISPLPSPRHPESLPARAQRLYPQFTTSSRRFFLPCISPLTGIWRVEFPTRSRQSPAAQAAGSSVQGRTRRARPVRGDRACGLGFRAASPGGRGTRSATSRQPGGSCSSRIGRFDCSPWVGGV